jgi:hypothetical protein
MDSKCGSELIVLAFAWLLLRCDFSCREGVVELMEKDAIRLALLRPTVPPASSSSSSSSSRGLASRSADVYFQQPSVIHLLLQEATMQERLAQALLERVSEVEASQTDVSGEKMSAYISNRAASQNHFGERCSFSLTLDSSALLLSFMQSVRRIEIVADVPEAS